MIEIQVKNSDIADILLGSQVITFSTENYISEKMRVSFFCEGICGKTYVEGFVNQIFSRHKLIDSHGYEYHCYITADLVLF